MAMKIVFNGREYADLADMPEDARRLCEDALNHAGRALTDQDGDGVLDGAQSGTPTEIRASVRSEIGVNGGTDHSLGEMPEEDRARYERAVRDGEPTHALDAGIEPSAETQPAPTASKRPGILSSHPIEADPRRLSAGVLIGIVLGLAALGAWWILTGLFAP